MPGPFDVRGMREMESNLYALEDQMRRQFIVRAARKGGKVFLSQAQRRAPSLSGELRKSLVERISTKARYGQVSALVGPGRNKGESNQAPGAYGLMVETGTKAHAIAPKLKKAIAFRIGGTMTSGGRIVVAKTAHPGSKAKPYLKPSFDSGKDAAFQAFAEQLTKDLGEFRARS